MPNTPIILVVVSVLVAFCLGWMWGASSRKTARRALGVVTLQQELVEGRNALLEARLDLYNVNFGEACRHIDAARTCLQPVADRLKDLGRTADVTRIRSALADIDNAQQMAVRMDQNANVRAAEAASIIAVVIASGVALSVVK